MGGQCGVIMERKVKWHVLNIALVNAEETWKKRERYGEVYRKRGP